MMRIREDTAALRRLVVLLLAVGLGGCPRGPSGSPGLTGTTGPTGPMGQPGPTGATGERGTAGASGLGSFCGSTPATTAQLRATPDDGGVLTGYQAAAAQCQVACVQPDAHMCSAAEMSLSQQRGLVPVGVDGFWYSAGAPATFVRSGQTGWMTECVGWLEDMPFPATLDVGCAWSGGPVFSDCNVSRSIACCR